MNMETDYSKLAEVVVKNVITIIEKPYNELDKPLSGLGYDSLEIEELTIKIEDGMREKGYALFAIPPEKDFTGSTIQEIIKYVSEEIKKFGKKQSSVKDNSLF